jgi:FAD/FMN-containing dehydrogenase
VSDRLVDALRTALGPEQALVDADVRATYETDWTGRFHGEARCIARPGSTAEVASVLRACAAAGAAVVPQGGNTGLVGGSVPRGGEVVLSTQRLDAVEHFDAEQGEMVVGAGVTLSRARDTARGAGWDVAVDLASRDSATIGGMVATNAGGEHVIRYGAMDRQVIGVEAVLSDGAVVGRVPALRKDNAGYHWAGMLGGSEGTLAVVTRVHLALVAELRERVVALVAVDGPAAALRVAQAVRRKLDSVLALELLLADGVALVREHRGLPAPFPTESPAYLLVECGVHSGAGECSGQLAHALASLDEVRDSAVAEDPAGRERLWAYRDGHTEAINANGIPHKLDVSLPYAVLARFIDEVPSTVAAIDAQARVVVFGHIGDGNVHVNVLGPAPDDGRVDHAVLELVAALGGSISAEHGIGVAKRNELPLVRSRAEIDAMRAVKHALDPAGILNPGVVL